MNISHLLCFRFRCSLVLTATFQTSMKTNEPFFQQKQSQGKPLIYTSLFLIPKYYRWQIVYSLFVSNNVNNLIKYLRTITDEIHTHSQINQIYYPILYRHKMTSVIFFDAIDIYDHYVDIKCRKVHHINLTIATLTM